MASETIQWISNVYSATNSECAHAEIRKPVVEGCREYLRAGCSAKDLDEVIKDHLVLEWKMISGMAVKLKESTK